MRTKSNFPGDGNQLPVPVLADPQRPSPEAAQAVGATGNGEARESTLPDTLGQTSKDKIDSRGGQLTLSGESTINVDAGDCGYAGVHGAARWDSPHQFSPLSSTTKGI